MQSEKAWKLQCSFSSFQLLQDGWNDFDFNVLQIFMVGTIARTLFGWKEKHRKNPPTKKIIQQLEFYSTDDMTELSDLKTQFYTKKNIKPFPIFLINTLTSKQAKLFSLQTSFCSTSYE